MAEMHLRALDMFLQQLQQLRVFLDDPLVQEIMVNHGDDVWVERGGKIERVAGLHIDNIRLRAAVKALATANDKDVQVVLDARMPGYRIAAALDPVAIKGGALCVRKHNASSRSLDDYVSVTSRYSGQAPALHGREELRAMAQANADAIASGGQDLVEFLAWCVQTRRNFCIAGATGSGKTTFMNALLGAIPPEDRVLTIEDTAELKVRAPNHVGLEASEQHGVDIRRLVRLALRFRPDRIVVGEVRGAEAFDLIDAMNTGHSGGGCTLHADSALFALYRLENMVRMSPNANNLPLPALRQLIAQTFDVIIYCSRLGGARRPVEVVLVEGATETGYAVQSVYRA